MAITSRRMTAEELLALPDDGMRHQLLAGELRTMAPNGRRHGRIGADLATALNQYVKAHRLGEVWGAETGCLLARNPDTLRAADVSFVRRARLGAQLDDQGYWPGAPDLVVEVLSPSDRRGEVAEKVATWLRHGAQMVVVVDARGGTVAVRRPNAPARTLTEADTLHGEDVIPGWSLAVREIFAVEPAGGPDALGGYRIATGGALAAARVPADRCCRWKPQGIRAQTDRHDRSTRLGSTGSESQPRRHRRRPKTAGLEGRHRQRGFRSRSRPSDRSGLTTRGGGDIPVDERTRPVRPAPSRWRWPLVGVVLITSTLAVSFVGLAALPTGILLAALLAARPPARAPAVIGALGGAVCAYSAIRAILAVGGDPDYTSRLGFGIVAFVLGLLATFAAPVATVRPRLAALTMLLAGTLGFLAINLYYINTWYGVGWLLLLAASGWALVYPLPVRPPRSRQ